MTYQSIPHLRGNQASLAAAPTPSVAVGAGAGSGASISSHTGTDEAGQISVLTAGTPAAGILATLTFATPYTVAPQAVSIDAGDAHSAVAGLYAAVTATTLTISFAGTAPGAAETLVLNYVVVGGA